MKNKITLLSTLLFADGYQHNHYFPKDYLNTSFASQVTFKKVYIPNINLSLIGWSTIHCPKEPLNPEKDIDTAIKTQNANQSFPNIAIQILLFQYFVININLTVPVILNPVIDTVGNFSILIDYKIYKINYLIADNISYINNIFVLKYIVKNLTFNSRFYFKNPLLTENKFIPTRVENPQTAEKPKKILGISFNKYKDYEKLSDIKFACSIEIGFGMLNKSITYLILLTKINILYILHTYLTPLLISVYGSTLIHKMTHNDIIIQWINFFLFTYRYEFKNKFEQVIYPCKEIEISQIFNINTTSTFAQPK